MKKNNFLFLLALFGALLGSLLVIYKYSWGSTNQTQSSPTPKSQEQAGYIEDNYYVIPLLGIRFKPEEELLRQKITSSFEYSNNTYSYSVHLSTEVAENLVKPCGASATGLVHLWRGKDKYQPMPPDVLIKQFGAFYITEPPPSYNCVYDDPKRAQTEAPIAKTIVAFEKSLKTVEEIRD